MTHSVVCKVEDHYSAFPLLTRLPDKRLASAFLSSPFPDHHGLGDLVIMVSADDGGSWQRTNDPTIPFSWPGSSVRERWDRFAAVMPDGSYLAAGSVGFEVWPPERLGEAQAAGLEVSWHPGVPDRLIVGGHRLFAQRSRDGGATWDRREITVPGFTAVEAFPRSAWLEDGTIIIPICTGAGVQGQEFAWRSGDGGDSWRLLPMTHDVTGAVGNETALVEVVPGRVLAHMRSSKGHIAGMSDALQECWSDDGGRTWSQPVETGIVGHPPHLLKLRDGRILCSYGYRHRPMGIRAVLSDDGGRTWGPPRVLRDDGGASCSLRGDPGGVVPGAPPVGFPDLGYPVSVELAGGEILTAYYITTSDGITHIAATRWSPDEAS